MRRGRCARIGGARCRPRRAAWRASALLAWMRARSCRSARDRRWRARLRAAGACSSTSPHAPRVRVLALLVTLLLPRAGRGWPRLGPRVGRARARRRARLRAPSTSCTSPFTPRPRPVDLRPPDRPRRRRLRAVDRELRCERPDAGDARAARRLASALARASRALLAAGCPRLLPALLVPDVLLAVRHRGDQLRRTEPWTTRATTRARCRRATPARRCAPTSPSGARFTTWRKLWIALAEARARARPADQRRADRRARARAPTTSTSRPRERYERELRHDVMAHVHALGRAVPRGARHHPPRRDVAATSPTTPT